MRELSVQELKAARDDGTADQWQVIDVREPWEHAICAMDGARPLPMQSLPHGVQDLDPRRPTVVVCHHGVRSFQVALWLERNGFMDVANLSGGIDAWAREIEPGMAQY
ncbi:MAG: rhodanese-like domain-containing protein [Pseudomonadota bacterium]|jgi:rhodanese-related sulfurtransferase